MTRVGFQVHNPMNIWLGYVIHTRN